LKVAVFAQKNIDLNNHSWPAAASVYTTHERCVIFDMLHVSHRILSLLH